MNETVNAMNFIDSIRGKKLLTYKNYIFENEKTKNAVTYWIYSPAIQH